MTAKEWADWLLVNAPDANVAVAINDDLSAAERERDALKARLEEARWLLERAHFAGDRNENFEDCDKRRDEWLKEGSDEQD